MINLVSEFEALAAAYDKVGEELTRALAMEDSPSPNSLAQSVLNNQDSLSQIEQMNSRVLLITNEWGKSRTTMDSQLWDEINRLAENALEKAVRLNQLCTATAKKIQSAKDKIAAELAEMGKGARYLQSAKTTKTNYPKFIDSMY